MGDNSYGYRPEGLVQNFSRRPEKFANGTMPLAVGKETSSLTGDLSRMVSHDSWNQSASFRENLGYSSADMKKLSRAQGQDGRSPAWEEDRRDGNRRNSSNPLDMTLARAQHHSSHAESSSSMQGSVISRNQSIARPNLSSSPYNSRGSHYTRPNPNPSFRSSRSSDQLREAASHNPVEIARLFNANGLQTSVDWRPPFRSNDVSIGHLPKYSDSQLPQRPLTKSRYPQNSPIPDATRHHYLQQEKRDEHHNPIERQTGYQASTYDRFPSPFEHLQRPQPGGPLQPGIDLTAAETVLPHSNGPKSYRVSDPMRPSKFIPDLNNVRAEQQQRRSFPVSQKSSEDLIRHPEPKKTSFSIEDITRLAQPQNPTPSDAASLSNPTRKSHLLGVERPAHLSSFTTDYYALATQAKVDTPNHFSVSNQLNPLYYPMLCANPFISASALPISGHSGQVTSGQQQPPFLHHQLRNPDALPAPNEPAKLSTNDGFVRSIAERRSDVLLNHKIQDRRSLIHDRDLKSQELREPRHDRDDSSISAPSAIKASSNVTSSLSLPTRSDPTAPVRLSPALHSYVPDPTPSGSANIFSRDVDMRRKNPEAAVQDTDMRLYLNSPPATVSNNSVPESSAKLTKKQKSCDVLAPKSRDIGPAELATSNQRRDFSTLNSNSLKFDSRAPDHDTHVQNSTPDSSVVKNKIKRKYNKSKHSQVVRQASKESAKAKSGRRSDEEGGPPKVIEPRPDKSKPRTSTPRAEAKSDAPKPLDSHMTSLENETASVAKTTKLRDESEKTEVKPKSRRGGYKRKHSLERPAETTAGDETNRLSSVDSEDGPKRGKRRKKSEQAGDEFYYWMLNYSTSEPDCDDSEDEDFRCPLRKPTPSRGRKREMRSRPMRQSRRNACESFFEPSSPEEQMSEEEKRSNKAGTAKRAGRKRGPKPGRARSGHGSPRKLKRVRKLPSEDDSEPSTSEISEQEVMPKKKRVVLPPPEKEEKEKKEKRKEEKNKEEKEREERLRHKPSPRRGRMPKKVLAKKKGLLNRKRKIEEIKKKVKPRHVGRPTKYKKASVKPEKEPTTHKNKQTLTNADTFKSGDNAAEVKNAEPDVADIVRTKEAVVAKVHGKKSAANPLEKNKKTRGKRSASDAKREMKVSRPVEDIKLNSIETKKNIHEAKTRKESSEAPSRKLSDASCTLVDLFNGKHKPSSSSVNELSDSPLESTTHSSASSLFADALTETEAQALNAATKSVCSNLDTPVLLNSSKTLDVFPPAPTKLVGPASDPGSKPQINLLSAKPDFDSSPKPLLDSSSAVTVTKEPIVKPTKKRGRPKTAISSKISRLAEPSAGIQLSPDVQKKLKLHPKNVKKSSVHTKYKLKNKLLNKDSERPRIGRPPGSGSKKKLQHSGLSPEIKKKYGRKRSGEVATKLSEINASLPRAGASHSPHASIHTKMGFGSWTPIPLRPQDKDRLVDSPSSSVSHTPVSSKHVTAASSRGSTPLGHLKLEKRTPVSSPLPPNMKKLTCNSAIGETVLHKAVRHGYMDNILHYLEHGFDVNTKDNAGYTALHEACVRGRVDAARLLLEFGADVNINSEEGTRPIHDAVEYDKVEVTRLLLSCGADPMLSKFSGRGVREMIHGNTMRVFLTAYLEELKLLTKSDLDDDARKWDIPASAIFGREGDIGCDVLANPPDEDSLCDDMEFELLDEEPPDTHLVRTSDTSGLSNYFLLSDLLHQRRCTRSQFLLHCPVDVKCAQLKTVTDDVELNWISKKIESTNDAENALVDLVAHESLLGQSRSFVVSGDGSVTLIPSKKRPTKPVKSLYPRGAYCEKRRYLDVRPQVNAEVPPEPAPPSSSKTSRRNSENASISSNSETCLSGVTELPTNLDDSKAPPPPLHPPPPIISCPINKTNLSTEIHNGFEIIPVTCSGPSYSTNAPTFPPPSTHVPETLVSPVQSYHYPGLDIARYSPTSDLRPPVSADSDPTRTLTETENAVLSLAIDSGLPSIHYHCPVSHPEAAKQFLSNFNNLSKSPKPNHVAE